MGRVLVTGDRHGDYKDVERFCLKWNTSKDDLLIVLGDNGVNYWGPHRDKHIKNYLASLPITFFMIKGNHDQRPSKKLYRVAAEDAHPLLRGTCLVEDAYSSLLFAPMYGACEFFAQTGWKKSFILGGAYSADKWYRLQMQEMGRGGYRWFPDEQLTNWEMREAEEMIHDYEPEIIFSHTCPFKYIPRDMFLYPDVKFTVSHIGRKARLDSLRDGLQFKSAGNVTWEKQGSQLVCNDYHGFYFGILGEKNPKCRITCDITPAMVYEIKSEDMVDENTIFVT